MGEVFSVSLSQQFQDLDLAEECITTAIQMTPTCSKSNHRMGLFQWTKVRQEQQLPSDSCIKKFNLFSQRNNFDSGFEYLTTAVCLKNENFYALIDWIELALHQPSQKSANMLKENFKTIFSPNFSWTPDQAARLTFLKGCFLFLVKGQKRDILNLWCQAYRIDGTTRHFLVTFGEAKRFRWKNFGRKEILNYLPKLSKSPLIKKMIVEVSNDRKKVKSNPQPKEEELKQKEVEVNESEEKPLEEKQSEAKESPENEVEEMGLAENDLKSKESEDNDPVPSE